MVLSSIDSMRKAEHSEGPATILAIATANPSHVIEQTNYADYLFRITNSDTEEKKQLKEKFNRICEKTMIKKRHTVMTEEMVRKNPGLCSYTNPSFDARQSIVVEEIPKLAASAAGKALKEWGRPVSGITHLLVSSTSGIDLPGVDYRLARLLGLSPSVNRIMLYTTGCHTGGTLLRLAKDVAENNSGARVLAVSAEVTVPFFRGPDANHFENLIGQAIFGDGAAALVIGCDPVEGSEKAIFQIVGAAQAMLPESDEVVAGHLREIGLTMHLKSHLPGLVADNLEECVSRVVKPMSIPMDWNSMFWAVHPGGRAILDKVEEKLGLAGDKLEASRRVLREYGNMMSPSVLFILDEIRNKSATEGKPTTGEGMEWGLLLGFGTGLSIETVVLHALPI